MENENDIHNLFPGS